MIICPACGAMNPDDAITCSECMALLDMDKLPKEKDDFAEEFSRSIGKLEADAFTSKKITDIMFVFDVTSSMHGEIRAMQDVIIDFANSVVSEGLDIRLGLIAFMDRTVGKEHKLYSFSDGVFTKKMKEFQEAVDLLEATAAGPAPEESSPDALMLALDQEFRDCPNKTIVLITDAPPRLPDKDTASYDQVIAKMNEKDINQFYVVTMLRNTRCQIHLQLLEGVQKYGGDGLAFELSREDSERKDHFKKVLKGLAKSISSKSVTV